MAHVALYAVFFLSGAAALLFQTVWFRQVGLALGNSVWASSLVLASFMAGLALGSFFASRRREQGPDALRLYAGLEATIGASGVLLAFVLPFLPGLMAPLLAPLRDEPLALNAVRVCVAFVLLLVPTTAMGATLPLLATSLSRREGFGPALGRLYGWNTLGAVAGALAGELLLVERFGLRGSATVAAGSNLLAAGVVFALARRLPPEAPFAPTASWKVAGSWHLLAAAAACGGILLALEVVWFRLLQLVVVGTSLTFSLMLAVVLFGIAAGGLLGGAWLRRSNDAPRALAALSLAAGGLAVLGYSSLDAVIRLGRITVSVTPGPTLLLASGLMLATSVLSGLLFTLLGTVLERRVGGEARAAGLLTLANTTGAMAGALVAGFLLLPRLGSELSIFVLALAYGGVALLLLPLDAVRTRRERALLGLAAAFFATLLAFYPFGLLQRSYVARLSQRFAALGSRPIAFREGLTDSLLYMRKEVAGEPASYRLVTNAVPMSATGFAGERYMKLFVYWALAVRPESRRALLISYGLGATASALAASPGLEAIDVVDISPDVLRMGRLAFPPPAPYPLDDPRVRTHVEDGRFFLLASRERYDLITAEPPPPRAAGVVSLYSREYFQLIRDRLTEGGVVTYWLPVFDVEAASMRSIVKGFCDAFPDCTLWNGCGFNWMLAGTRGLEKAPDPAAFGRQWSEAAVAPTLSRVALDTPEHLGALFLADAEDLRELVGEAPPLVDDFPMRLSLLDGAAHGGLGFYAAFMDAGRSRDRFATSPFIAKIWPPALREGTRERFFEQDLFNRSPNVSHGQLDRSRYPTLVEALTRTTSRVMPLVMAGSAPDEQAAVDRAVQKGAQGAVVEFLLGLRALSSRDYLEAERLLARVAAAEPEFTEVPRFRALALCLAGAQEAAAPLLAQVRSAAELPAEEKEFWSGFERTCLQVAPSP